MNLQEQLEEERRIINGVTPAPWQELTTGDLGYTFWGVDGEPDVEHVADGMALVDLKFIAHARTALPQRNAQLQAVIELIREERAQGYNAVSLDRLTRAIKEADRD